MAKKKVEKKKEAAVALIDDALCVSLVGAVFPGSHCVGVCGLEGVGTVDRLVGGDLPHHHALKFSVASRRYMRRALSLFNTDGIYLCGVCVRSPHVVRSVGQADGRTDGTSSIRRYGDKGDSIDRSIGSGILVRGSIRIQSLASCSVAWLWTGRRRSLGMRGCIVDSQNYEIAEYIWRWTSWARSRGRRIRCRRI